jgi:hypothetical protein
MVHLAALHAHENRATAPSPERGHDIAVVPGDDLWNASRNLRQACSPWADSVPLVRAMSVHISAAQTRWAPLSMLEVGLRLVGDADAVQRRSPQGSFEPRHGVEERAHLARARSSNGHRRVRSYRHGVRAVSERPTTHECSALRETDGPALARDSCASVDDDQHLFGKLVFAHENPARRHIDLAHQRVEEPQLRAAAGVEHREFPEFRRVVSPAQKSISSPPQSHLASRPDLGDHLLRRLQTGCERVVTACGRQIRLAVVSRPWS